MYRPPTEYLSRCLVAALLDFYHIDQPPVPVRRMINSPPPDLAYELMLVEVPGLPFRNAEWVRLHDGQGRVFVDLNVSEARRRYAMARAMFIGLCSSRGGRAAGLDAVLKTALDHHAAYFARQLLMPIQLLSKQWQYMSAKTLGQIFEVPAEVAEARLRELRGFPLYKSATT